MQVCGAADVWPYSLFKAEVLIGFRDICERGEKIPGMPNIELENALKQEKISSVSGKMKVCKCSNQIIKELFVFNSMIVNAL